MSIFLSYSHADKSFARLIYHDLKDLHIPVLIDEGEMLGGDSLIKKIEEAIDSTDSVGVILSQHSVNSNWVQEEVKMALHRTINGRKMIIIPLLMEDCEIPGFLLDKYFIDFRNNTASKYEESLALLVNTLRGIKTKVPKVERSKIALEDSIVKPPIIDVLSDLVEKGNRHHFKKEYVEAIQCYDQLITNPNFLIALNNKATSLLDLEKYDEATMYYEFVLEFQPKYDDAWVGKGLTYAKQGEFSKSISYYDKAISINQKNFGAWVNKGNALSELEVFGGAIECYDHAIDINSHNPAVWINKGAALTSFGRYGEGIQCYDYALEIDPCNRVAWYNKGLILRQLDRAEEALECYNRSLEIEPDNINTLYNKGAAHFSLRQFHEADSCYNKILQLNPRYADALGDKGAILSEMGKYDEAIELYDKALHIDSTIARFWYNKGTTLELLGRNDEAKKCLDKADILSRTKKTP